MGDFLATIGRSALDFFASVGRLFIFAGVALSHIVRPPFYFKLTLRQMLLIGYNSLPVVGLTSLFTGMVLALQSHTGFAGLGGDAGRAAARPEAGSSRSHTQPGVAVPGLPEPVDR